MKISEILAIFTARETIDLSLTAEKLPEATQYPPIGKYILDLSRPSKPETASEHLFRELAKDVLKMEVFSQVKVGDGFVDFVLPEINGSAVVLELKPLFQWHNETELRRYELRPRQHIEQVQKYLREHEYVILSDLKDAYLYSARDGLVEDTYFASLPFAELLSRQAETLSLLDVLRRAEDAVEKPELDRQFFTDLKEWYETFAQVHFAHPEDAAELIILLINKIIFAKTLEDYGLVAYRWIQDEYEKQKERWGPKGTARVIRAFLHEFETFFDEYYDTELFERKIWNELDHAEENLARFARALDLVLGVTKWDRVFSRGVVHYNYRQINEDIFGKSYEMFLAANRKDEGIYYTPAAITKPMADSLVSSLFAPLVDQICDLVHQDRCDFAAASDLILQLGNLRIADTAAGSGGFLIKILRAIWQQYLRIEHALEWMQKIKIEGTDLFDLPQNLREATQFRRHHSFDTKRILVARIILLHLFAVDKDPGALEVAKTNVWKEAVKLTPPDYNFRQLTGEAQRILPNLELNFICADSLVDIELEKQIAYLSEYSQHALQQLWRESEKYIANPSDHAPLQEAIALREKLRANMAERFQGESLPEAPAFLALMFFPCYFGTAGQPRENPGFDGIIGNPPWEAVKPVRKEFSRIDKYSMSVVDFDAWFKKRLEGDADFRARWESYQQHYADYKVYLDQHFQHQGTGDWNYFKLFIENNLRLTRNGGRLSLLVPSSIQTDEGCAALRKLFITENTLEELTSFENRGYSTVSNGGKKTIQIFPDVDSRFKFGFFKLRKGEPTPSGHTFDARFYLHDPARVFDPPIKYSVEMMRRFSPQNLSFMEFRSEADYGIYSRIRANHPLLEDIGFRFRRELHSSDDRRFFHPRRRHELKEGEMPLYEGKMIYQFNPHYSPGSYYVREGEVREECLRKEIYRLSRVARNSPGGLLEGDPIPRKKEDLETLLRGIFKKQKFRLQYELERLAYRQVGSSTNERTLIAALLPPRVAIIDTLMYLNPYRYEMTTSGGLAQRLLPSGEIGSLLSLMNSLVLNYYVRSKVSTHVNIFHVYELPIPPLDKNAKQKLADAAAKLSAQPDDLKERAQLEVFIARDLYHLSLEDWRHLTGSFIYGGASASKAELDEIIRLSLERWEQ